MKRLGFICGLFISLCTCTQGALPEWTSPIDKVEWIHQQNANPTSPEILAAMIQLLNHRERIQTPSGFPTSPANEARKFLRERIEDAELQLLEPFHTAPPYAQTLLLSLLGEGEKKASLFFLREQLDHSSSSIRGSALDALVNRHEKDPFSLTEWFESGWQMQSPDAMKLPGRIRSLDSIHVLLNTYAQYREDAARAASSFWSLTVLTKTDPEGAKEIFKKIESLSQKAALARAITETTETQPEEFLITLFENETDPQILAQAIEGLDHYTSDKLKRHLLDALFFSPSGDVTLATANLIGRSGDPNMAIPLAYRSLTLSEAAKEQLGQALIALGPPASEVLCKSLTQPNFLMVKSSLNALMRMGETASDAMYEAIMRPELGFDIRNQLQLLIERAGRPAKTEEQQVFFRLLMGIELAGHHHMRPWLPLLQEWTNHPIDQIRIGSYEVLGYFRDPVSTDLLIDALKGPDIAIANVAAKGLEPQIFTLSSRIEATMNRASIAEARVMADALALIEFLPHRFKERALFEATRERWQRLNRLPAPAADGILEAFVKAQNPQRMISLAWAVSHLDPDSTPGKLSTAFPGLPPLLPWTSRDEKIQTVNRIEKFPPLQRRKIIALAACSNDPAITLPALAYLNESPDFPFDLLVRIHESDRFPLVDFAHTALSERNYNNLSPLAAALQTTSKRTARLLAERLDLEGYTPQTFDEALIFHDLLGNWQQLIAMGEPGVDRVRENVKTMRGMEAIDRYIGLAGVENSHPVVYLANMAAARPRDLLPDLFKFYQDQPTLDFTPLFAEWIKKSNDGASFVFAQLLQGLDYKTEDPLEQVILGYAQNNILPVLENEEIGRNFLLDELMTEEDDRLSRASIWSLKHRNFTLGKVLRISRSMNTREEIEAILQDENDLIVLSTLSLLPTLHKNNTNQLEIVDILLPLLESDRLLPTQNGAVLLSTQVAKTLIAIGEDAVKPLLSMWAEDPKDLSQAAYFTLLSIPSPALVNLQKQVLKNRNMTNDAGLLAVINTLAITRDPSTVPTIYEIALEKEFDVRVAAMNALVEIGEPAIPILIDSLEIGEPERHQRIAAAILSDIGGEQVTQAFLQILKSRQTNLRKPAIDYLVKTRPPEALPLFIDLLDSPNVNPSLAGASALVEWGEEAIPYILDTLFTGSERSRMLKQSTLRRITGKDFGSDPQAWQNWYRSTLQPANI